MARSKKKLNIMGALKMVLSDDPAAIITDAFEHVKVAEQELLQENKKVSDCTFKLLLPKNKFHGLSLTIFRHHCRELIERVKTEHSTQPGTKAEVMIALSSTSLGVPLASSYAKLYAELFNEIMQPAEPMEVGQYDWPDEGMELLDMLRVKTRQDWRK